MAKVTLGVTEKDLNELIKTLKALGCDMFDHLTLNSS